MMKSSYSDCKKKKLNREIVMLVKISICFQIEVNTMQHYIFYINN